MNRAFFITGTDTDVGKTTVAAGLLHTARNRGLTTAAVKPVASGCERTADGLRNADALTLWAECTLPLTYAQVNPVALEPAIAPHLAAQAVATELTATALLEPVSRVLALRAELTVVEGAGGWRVPLQGGECLSDVAIALQLPVILVVGIRLGCINHALLTAEAIRRDGLTLAGWVANARDARSGCIEQNIASLASRLAAPCLGRIPPLSWVSATQVGACLDVSQLLLPR